MVRKDDFVSGERLLQSFPYIILDKTWLDKLRKNTLILAEKTHHYFSGTKADYSIRSWQKRIIKYLEEQLRLPFPLFRLFPEWLRIYDGKQFLKFQSARGENFQLPLYLTGDIAYLVGVIMGDGHLAEYFINIIDASQEHIENLATSLKGIFKSKLEMFKQSNANAWNVNILGKWVVRFFNFLSGQPINERKYLAIQAPKLFTHCNDDSFLTIFWRGVLDADAGYRRDVIFTSASKQLIDDFIIFLQNKNMTYRYTTTTNTKTGDSAYSVRILGSSRETFLKVINTNHPQKKDELLLTVNRTQPERVLARKEDASWIGRVASFNKSRLTSLGYFTLENIKDLSVANAGALIQSLRKDQQNIIARHLSVPPSLFSNYVNNKRATPLLVLQQLLDLSSSQHDLMTLLKSYNLSLFTIHKAQAVLPFKPNQDLLMVLQGLQVKKDYFLIIGLPDQSYKEYKNRLRRTFQLSTNSTSSKRFYNKVLYQFIKTFCNIEF